MKKEYLENLIKENFEKVFYENDISITGIDFYREGDAWCEIEFYSKYGGDQIETIHFDVCSSDKNTLLSFMDGVYDLSNDFDVDNYVELWVDSRGQNGVPATVRELLEDGEDIKETLIDLYEDIKQHYKNNIN